MLDQKSLRKLAALSVQERLARQEIIHRLAVAFRLKDEETQEQLIADTAGTPVEYLEKACAYFREDFPEPHCPRGGQINLRARVIASVRGDTSNRMAWKGQRGDLTLEAGKPVEKIGATVGEMEKDDPAHNLALTTRAREIREEGKLVPRLGNRSLSWICAVIELGGKWELDEEQAVKLDKVMQEHEGQGGDAAWWWAERETPTITRTDK